MRATQSRQGIPHALFQKGGIGSGGFEAVVFRKIVSIHVVIPHRIVESGAHDVYLLANVRDRQGHVLDAIYQRYPEAFWRRQQTRNASRVHPVDTRLAADFYARPGAYTVTVVLYDRAANKSNVYRHEIEIHQRNDNPLTQLEDKFPLIEFLGKPVAYPPEIIPPFPLVVRQCR